MADTSSFAPPWMPSPATFVAPPALPDGYYQGSAAGNAPVTRSHDGGSIGTFFAVLAAVLVLTAVSCVFGRVCRRQAEGPDEMYDCTRLSRRWRWWGARPRIVDRRGAKPPPVEEVPAALPLPEP
uniref:Uncharacterized protein n=1 Tax=Avena sativa TaxID=4498 RepID=A0ACD5YY04_AVESA